MSGLGRKVFTAGEVLNAADVNGYLMDQSVMVFADSTARSSAIGTATEGMVTYLQDSDSIEVATGTATWASVGSFASGTEGYTALSNGTAGITYQPVSHNYIINGAFDVWQRGTSLSDTGYLADRWLTSNSGSTVTTSQQSFTPADLNIIGFGEASFYNRCDVTSVAGAGNFVQWLQRVEDVRTLASQVVTLSYWAKADSSKSVAIELQSAYGSGGSSNVNTFIVKQALTTSWARYSHTFTMPSVSGKTIGTGSYSDFRWWLDAGSNFDARTDSLGQQNITFDIWGVQLEAGSVATPFKRHAPSLQGELAACQRYYTRLNATGNSHRFANGIANSTTLTVMVINLPTVMRAVPSVQPSNLSDFNIVGAGGAFVPNGFAQIRPAGSTISTNMGVSGTLTADNLYQLRFQTATTYLELDSEL